MKKLILGLILLVILTFALAYGLAYARTVEGCVRFQSHALITPTFGQYCVRIIEGTERMAPLQMLEDMRRGTPG